MSDGSAAASRHWLAAVDDLLPGTLLRVDAAGRALCLARTEDGSVHVLDDSCTHEGASLSEGELEGCEVECPMHLSRFDLRTGAALSLPAVDAANVYSVEIRDGQLYVLLDDQDHD